MTPDQAIALSCVSNLSRVGLTDRLMHDDPELVECAERSAEDGRRVRARAASLGIQVLAWNDPRFPVALLTISDAPPALWYRGGLSTLTAPAVAVVGSRAATAVALETAARLGAELAARGVTVVSGLARGVDSAAHRGALRFGRMIAVLGSGPNRVYPPEHDTLAAQIERDGLVVAEYPPDMPPLAHHFPQRNRLISGLSRAVVVIDASDKSGSLITAGCALEQSREVMVVPGNVLTGRNCGGHALIRDGAAIVECAEDVLAELGLTSKVGSATGPRNDEDEPNPAGRVDRLLGTMEAGQVYHVDDLVGL